MSLEITSFKEAPLEMIDGDRGKNYPKQDEFSDEGFCLFLNAKNVTDKGFNFETKMFISQEKDEILKKGKLQRGDVILTTRGTVGNVAFYSEDIPFDNIRINSGMLILRSKSELSNKFLYYVLKSDFFKKQIYTFKSGTAQPQLPISSLNHMEFYLPEINIQKKIVTILSNIDKKIKVLEEINNNLEQLLNSVFNYWFISFDKFDKSSFVESKLGEIPEEWTIGVLKDLLSLTKNPIKPSETNGLPYLPIDIIPMNSLGISELKSDEEANSSLITFDKNDILIGAMRVYFHRVVISPCYGVTRSTCFVLKPKKEYYLSYLLLLCNLDQTIQYAQNTSKGTTMPYAVWDNGLGDMDIIIPPDNILNEFHNLVFPIIEKIRDSYTEINKLQKLRDTLLPKLMSGEIDVSKINYDLNE